MTTLHAGVGGGGGYILSFENRPDIFGQDCDIPLPNDVKKDFVSLSIELYSENIKY